MNDLKWYQQNWFIILLLVLFFPVGLYLMWKYSDWSSKTKWIVTGALVVFVFLISITGDSPKTGNLAENNPRTSNVIEQQEKIEKPTKPLSEKEQIQNIVSSQLEGSNNMDKPYIRKIDVIKNSDGSWDVIVKFNADDNFSADWKRSGIESKTAEIYIALYTSDKKIHKATVLAFFPLVDKYGNESDGLVYASVLGAAEADKVNWSAEPIILKSSILPAVWTTTRVHPGLR